ncbi:MAG: DUF2461 domain-containing protein [Kofleriaceae bacterium]
MFQGFDKTAPAFFAELAIEMNKTWFDANKQRYQDLWVTPMTELLTEVGTKLKYGKLKIGSPKIFRIYRDVRFAKDKTPYKTHCAATLGFQKEMSGLPLYFHVGLEDEYAGAGTYFFEDNRLAQWRKLVAADKTGKPLVALVTKLRKAGYNVGGHEDYKRVPKPYDQDHPRAEFLKMRGLTAGFPEMPRGMLHKKELVGWLAKHANAVAPLVTWLATNIKK